MLGHPDEKVGFLPCDGRMPALAEGGEIMKKIMTKTILERHIKSIESLEKPAVFAKIWKAIDECAQKVAKKPIEQVN